MRTGAMPANRRDSGFTIIELMIVVSIIGVLAAIAIPAFNDLIKDNRRTVVVNELVSSLMLARAEAAKRGAAVTVCGNTAGGGTSCTGGANWDHGWMIFIDPNFDGAIAAVADMIRSYRNDYPDIRVRTSTAGTGHVTLQPFNQSGTVGVITVCDKRGSAKARVVNVASNGRARVAEKLDDGSAPTCP